MPDYPHVKGWQRDIVARYGKYLTNTGGNDPLDLINDLQNPVNLGFGRTNMPRFVLAVAVDSQVALLSVLELRGVLPPQGSPEQLPDAATDRDVLFDLLAVVEHVTRPQPRATREVSKRRAVENLIDLRDAAAEARRHVNMSAPPLERAEEGEQPDAEHA